MLKRYRRSSKLIPFESCWMDVCDPLKQSRPSNPLTHADVPNKHYLTSPFHGKETQTKAIRANFDDSDENKSRNNNRIIWKGFETQQKTAIKSKFLHSQTILPLCIICFYVLWQPESERKDLEQRKLFHFRNRSDCFLFGFTFREIPIVARET